MPSKYFLRNFETGKTYHLMHRGKLGQQLFTDTSDYKSFILTLSYYLRFPDGAPLSWIPRLSAKALATKQGQSQYKNGLPVTLHSFLLLPDHFHLILTENISTPKPGISELMRRLSVGYAMTYRKKHGGSGPIYQGKYKMTPIDDNSIPTLIHYLHSHPDTNQTYLRDPLHSSLSDYTKTPRSWIRLMPTIDSPDVSSLGKLTLD